jgi:cytolysin-activating lysine-acyltransferase
MNDGTNNGKPMNNLRLAPRQKPAEAEAANTHANNPFRTPTVPQTPRPHLEDIFAATPKMTNYQRSPQKQPLHTVAPTLLESEKPLMPAAELRKAIVSQRPPMPAASVTTQPVKQIRAPLPVVAPTEARKPLVPVATPPVRSAPAAQAAQAVTAPANDKANTSAKLAENFGAFVQNLAETQRYRHVGLGETISLFYEPMQRDRVAIALAGPSEEEAHHGKPSAFMIWASVSPQVDEKIRDQIAAGVFPLRLSPQDWNSGSINWLLDVVASTSQLRSAALTSFVQTKRLGELRLHPIINRLVDSGQLEKLGIAPRPETERKSA